MSDDLDTEATLAELAEIDETIEKSLTVSRYELTKLLHRREQIVRKVCVSPTSVSEKILEFATIKAPEPFNPTEALEYCIKHVGPAVYPNLITAWCSKLVSAGQLTRQKRGIYALA
jgi:hypothetical protein